MFYFSKKKDKRREQQLAQRPRNSDAALLQGRMLLPLCTIEQCPKYLQDNRFILGGYRRGYSTAMCLRSIFSLHNQTGNVWTHLIGFFVLLLLSVHVVHVLIQPHLSHYVVFTIFSLGNLLCMLFSTMFHLFIGHHSVAVHDRLMSLDYFGITCLVVASFVPPCYYVFHCHPQLQLGYLSMIAVLGSIGLFGPFFDSFVAEHFFWKRIGVYLLLVGSGIFPTIHTIVAFPMNHTSLPILRGVGLMFFLYAAGLVIYLSKVPERWFPGRFDLWLHSHQLWHVFVLCSAVVHFFTCTAMYQQWEVMSGRC